MISLDPLLSVGEVLAIRAGNLLRLGIGGIAMAWLLYQTYERASGDMDDPSVSVGRDYLLIRASGIVAIAAAVGVVGLSWAPEILATRRGMAIGIVLFGLLGYWYISENEEVED